MSQFWNVTKSNISKYHKELHQDQRNQKYPDKKFFLKKDQLFILKILVCNSIGKIFEKRKITKWVVKKCNQ